MWPLDIGVSVLDSASLRSDLRVDFTSLKEGETYIILSKAKTASRGEFIRLNLDNFLVPGFDFKDADTGKVVFIKPGALFYRIPVGPQDYTELYDDGFGEEGDGDLEEEGE